MDTFTQFLQCDTYRGDHSTGVCAIFKPHNGDGFVKMSKMAVDGFDFAKTQVYKDTISHSTPSSVGTAVYKTFPKAVFGHNRYATVGEVNAVNAHPFECGHITLAHNGTLNYGWKDVLPNGKDFTVDSHCVSHSVATNGIDWVIQHLNGAFCLIWHDAIENTVNIIRNDERPFHLWELVNGDWFGCSEEKMGDWLLTRGKFPKKFKRHFECEPGVQYVFDVSSGCVLKEERKHELPVFQKSYNSWSSWGKEDPDSYSDWWEERQQRHSGSVSQGPWKDKQAGQEEDAALGAKTRINKSLEKSGLDFRYGDFFKFSMFQFDEYPKRPGFGKVTGYINDHLEYVEVHVHDVAAEEFVLDKIGYVKCTSAFESTNAILTIIGIAKDHKMEVPSVLLIEHKEEPWDDDQDFSFLDTFDDGDSPIEVRTMTSGESFTEKEWRDSHHNVCSLCSNPIMWEEMETATVENGYCFCGDCVEATDLRKEKTKKPSQVESFCVSCGEYHGLDVINGTMNIATWTSLSTTCYWKNEYRSKFTNQGRPILSLKKEVTSSESCETFRQTRESFSDELVEKTVVIGTKLMKITPVQWAKMNVCRACSDTIPFTHADLVEFWGHAPMCLECSEKMV